MYIKREQPTGTRRLSAAPVIEHPAFDDGKEYIVCLKKDVDYDNFWQDMETLSTAQHIPSRPVRIFNERTVMKRICHYVLTDEEATLLRNDSRVLAVEIPPIYRQDIVKQTQAIQTNNFSKPIDMYTATGDLINYGLTRTNSDTNNYHDTLITEDNYDYTLTGKGVDVVVHDTGLEIEHPEFQDSEGNSRVQQVDWYIESGRNPRVRVPVNLKNNTNFVVTTNSTIQFNTTPDSDPISFSGNLMNALALGLVNGCMYGIKSGVKENSRMVHYSYYGGTSTSWQSLGSVIWEVKFCDNNAIEVFVWRHDDSSATWGLYTNGSNEPVVDLSDFAVESLVGESSQPVNFVLTTNDDGITWEVTGAPDRPHHLELINDEWEVVPGLGYYPEFGYQLNSILQQTLVNRCFSIGSVFPFDFHLFDIFTTPMPRAFYVDTVGHGTHVGGIIAGKTYGWAKDANIYLMKVAGLEGPEGDGIDDPDIFDLLIEWHTNKPIVPETGFKRPTIVNMSWGYGSSLYWFSPLSGMYRGQYWQLDDNLDLTTVGFPPDADRVPARVYSVDVSIEEMIDAGIHICIAAGNDSFKIDAPGGIDYDNKWSPDTISEQEFNNPASSDWAYLHRGSSPYSDRAIISGCMDAYNTNSGKETRSYFSNGGAGVSVYAPGHSIMSSTSLVTDLGSYDVQPYFLNEDWTQCNLSGTSMASPQTCGLGAVFLELNPGATPAELKQFIVNNAKTELYSTGLDDDFDDIESVFGGDTRVLFNPFNSPNPFKINKG